MPPDCGWFGPLDCGRSAPVGGGSAPVGDQSASLDGDWSLRVDCGSIIRGANNDVNHVEAVEQVLSNLSGLHAREGPIGGGNHSEHCGIPNLSTLQELT